MLTTDPVDQAAEAVLLAHLKRDIKGCTCGWAELGRLHQTHQVAMLREAGLLADALPAAGG